MRDTWKYTKILVRDEVDRRETDKPLTNPIPTQYQPNKKHRPTGDTQQRRRGAHPPILGVVKIHSYIVDNGGIGDVLVLFRPVRVSNWDVHIFVSMMA